MNFRNYLRKLEKAAMVAFIEMPISAKAKLNTRKLLGVRKSRIFKKAITVTAFINNPRRPSEHTRDETVVNSAEQLRNVQEAHYITSQLLNVTFKRRISKRSSTWSLTLHKQT